MFLSLWDDLRSAVVDPVVKTIVSTLTSILPALFYPLIFSFVNIILVAMLDFAINLSTHIQIITIDPNATDKFSKLNNFLEKISFNDIYHVVQVAALALVVLVASFQILKSMYAHLGFETDEPWKIGIRLVIFTFLAMYAKEICQWFLFIYASIFNSILGTGGFNFQGIHDSISNGAASIGKVMSDSYGNIEYWKNIISGKNLPIGQSGWMLVACIYIVFKIIVLLIRFVEKQVIFIILMLFSPLAFMTGISKSTKQYLNGWMKAFVGNLLLQIVLYTIFIMINIYIRKSPIAINTTDFIISLIIIIGFTKAFDKVEDLVRDAGLSLGGASGPLASPTSLASQMANIKYSFGQLGGGGGFVPPKK